MRGWMGVKKEKSLKRKKEKKIESDGWERHMRAMGDSAYKNITQFGSLVIAL